MRAEYTAFKGRLADSPLLVGKVDTAVRVTNDGSAVRANYVIAFPSVGALDDERFTAPQTTDSKRAFSNDVRVVAVDADGLLLLAEAVQSQMVGHVLSVAGRTCTPMRLDLDSDTVGYDKTARLFCIDMTFEFESMRTG